MITVELIEHLKHTLRFHFFALGNRIGIYGLEHELPEIQKCLIDLIRHNNLGLTGGAGNHVMHHGIQSVMTSRA